MPSFLAKIKPAIRPLPPGVSAFSYEALLATWFGSGRIRPASGTIGTLAAVPFGYGISWLGGSLTLAIAAMIVLFAGSLVAGSYSRKAGVKDDQAIVVDEVAGMWIAAIPATQDLSLWILAFVLFRLFDIYKPWPASFFDKRGKNGFDIMMDDVVAGIFAFMGVASWALYLSTNGLM